MIRNLLVLAAAMSTVAAAAPWRSHAFPEAGFRAEAPAEFSFRSEEAGYSSGAKMRIYGVHDGDVVYRVVSIGGPAITAGEWEMGPAAVANAVADGVVSDSKQLSRTRIAYPGGGAVELYLDFDGLMARARVIAMRPWVLLAEVMVKPGQEAALKSPEADRFLNSVKVVIPAT